MAWSLLSNLFMATAVLVVEPETRSRETLSTFLDSFSGMYDVTAVGTGDEAIATLESNAGFQVLVAGAQDSDPDQGELLRWCGRHAPNLQILATASSGTAETHDTAIRSGAVRLIERPIDLTALESTINDLVRNHDGVAETVSGLGLIDIAAFFSKAGGDKVFVFSKGDDRGVVALENGSLVHCSMGGRSGTDAFFSMTLWGDGTYSEVPDAVLNHYPRNIDGATDDLIEEAGRLIAAIEAEGINGPPPASAQSKTVKLEARKQDARPGAAAPAAEPCDHSINRPSNEEVAMAIKDHLGEFQSIEGFKGIAVFTAQGEMIDSISTSGIDAKSIGMFANNALLNAQKATDQMGVGRGNLMQIRAPKAVILMRCLNEATDFAASKDGKAHFHTVVIMEPEGNTGMATMMLDRACDKVAEELR